MSACPFASFMGDEASSLSAAASSDALAHADHVEFRFSQSGNDEPSPQDKAVSSAQETAEMELSSAPSSFSPQSKSSGYAQSSATAAQPSGNSQERLTRRQLRMMSKDWSLAEVRQHTRKDDAWVAVDGKVYDISEHLDNHPGWNATADISTALSILAHAGTDCSEEFREIHRPYPVAWRQLRTYYIGDLAPSADPSPAA